MVGGMVVRVLIVDDSRISRELLAYILSSDSGIHIAGTVASGELALAFLSRNTVDVVTMDIEMPGLDGYETTQRIMESYPLPIVVVSAAWDPSAADKTFRALQAGAVAVMAKPVGPANPAFMSMKEELVRTVKAMAGLPVVRRRFRPAASDQDLKDRRPAGQPHPWPVPAVPALKREIVVVGASTGGPAAITEMLSRLPKPFPLPILIVQHIAAGFLAGMAGWLGAAAGMPVFIASDGETPKPGQVYLAPDALHMTVGKDGRIRLVDEPPDSGLRPSVARLFASAAEAFGPRSIGVLLSGMGQDGAEELGLMRSRGAETIAQDEESSVVFGMPGEAVRRKAARHILPPSSIAELLFALTQ